MIKKIKRKTRLKSFILLMFTSFYNSKGTRDCQKDYCTLSKRGLAAEISALS